MFLLAYPHRISTTLVKALDNWFGLSRRNSLNKLNNMNQSELIGESGEVVIWGLDDLDLVKPLTRKWTYCEKT